MLDSCMYRLTNSAPLQFSLSEYSSHNADPSRRVSFQQYCNYVYECHVICLHFHLQVWLFWTTWGLVLALQSIFTHH